MKYNKNTIDEILKPLNEFAKGKEPKVNHLILGIYQGLAADKALTFTQKLSFLGLASQLTESNDEMTLIKILQILLLIITREDIIRAPMAKETSALCLHLLNDKSQVVKNNVFAVLQQMYSLLFGKCAEACKEKASIEELHKVCYEELKKLTLLLEDDSLKYLGMDILTMIFAKTKLELLNTPRMIKLLENQCISKLKSFLKTGVNSFTSIIRTIKCSTQLMLSLNTYYDLLQHILILADSTHLWQQYLALESFSILFAQPRQLVLMSNMINDCSDSMVAI